MEDYMREIVDVGAFEAGLRVLAIAGPLVGLLVGAAIGAQRRLVGRFALRGLCVGLLGSVVYGLWAVYDYLTRYDPETNYAGLHRLSALALSCLIFVAAGIACALGLRAIFRATKGESPAETDASG